MACPTRVLVLVLPLLLRVTAAQQPDLGAAKAALEVALRSGDQHGRLAAIESFAANGSAAAMKVLLDHVHQASVSLAKTRDDYSRLGKRISDETKRRIDDLIHENLITPTVARAINDAEKELGPLRKQQEDIAKKIDEAQEVHDALVGATGELVRKAEASARPSIVQVITGSWRPGTPPPDKVDLLGCLVEVAEPAALALVSDAAQHDDLPAIRVAALEALLRHPQDAAEPVAIAALKDPAWQVRTAALSLLRAVGGRDAMPVLIDAMSHEDGRLRDDVVTTLAAIAKVNFHDNATLWKDWWEREGGAFDGHGAKAGVKGAKPPPSAVGDKRAGGSYFYGIRTQSKHIIFVLDISGSMNFALDDPAIGMSRPAMVGKRRIDAAIKELGQAIAALDEDGTFNIITFETGVTVWQPSMQKASKQNKAAAKAWAEKIVAAGNTNIFDAFEKAFAFIGRATFDKGYQSMAADTIIFMSDGTPNRGRIIVPTEIRREVRQLNQLQRVQIHCVALSVGADADLLAQIAKENDGQFVHVK